MLTGETPFEGQSPMVLMTKHLTEAPEPPRRLNPDVSRGASELVLQMLEKDKEDRPQTPSELIKDVQQVLSGKSPGSGGGGRSRSARRKRKTGRSPRMGDSQRREAPSRGGGGGGRTRVRASRHVRGGKSGETTWLLVIPAVVIAMIGAAIAMSLQGAPLGPAPTPAGANDTPESASALKAARKLHLSSPGEARARYQDIIQRFPKTHAASEAQRYLDELNGG